MGILPILKNAKKKFRAVLRPKMLNFQIWLLYYLNAQGKSLSIPSIYLFMYTVPGTVVF